MEGTKLCLVALAGLMSVTFAMIGDPTCTPTTACHECADTYIVDHAHIARPIGCFNSKGDDQGNALPYSSLSNHRDGHGNDILWPMWNCSGNAAQIIYEFCGKEALALGKKYFGVEFYGECYFGDESDIDRSQGMVSTSECNTKCKWDVGAPDVMMIYKIEDVLGGYRCPTRRPPSIGANAGSGASGGLIRSSDDEAGPRIIHTGSKPLKREAGPRIMPTGSKKWPL